MDGGFGLGALASRGLLGAGFGSAIVGIVARPVSAQEGVAYVDQQQVAVLLFALGQYPVPEVFQSTSMAASPG